MALNHTSKKYRKNGVLMQKDPLPSLRKFCKEADLGDAAYRMFKRERITVDDLLGYTSKDLTELKEECGLGFCPLKRILKIQKARGHLYNPPPSPSNQAEPDVVQKSSDIIGGLGVVRANETRYPYKLHWPRNISRDDNRFTSGKFSGIIYGGGTTEIDKLNVIAGRWVSYVLNAKYFPVRLYARIKEGEPIQLVHNDDCYKKLYGKRKANESIDFLVVPKGEPKPVLKQWSTMIQRDLLKSADHEMKELKKMYPRKRIRLNNTSSGRLAVQIWKNVDDVDDETCDLFGTDLPQSTTTTTTTITSVDE